VKRPPNPWLAASTWLLALAAFVSASAARAAPLEAYGQLPSMEDVTISPDGTRIAFVRAAESDRFVAIRTIADAKPLGLLRVGEAKLRSLEWADNNRLMIVTSVTGVPRGLIGEDAEWAQLQVYDVTTGKSIAIPDEVKLKTSWNQHTKVVDKPDKLSERQAERLASIIAEAVSKLRPMNTIAGRVAVRSLSGHTVLFFQTYCVFGQPVPALMRADLDSGEGELFEIALDRSLVGWSVDAAGAVVAEQHYNEKMQSWSVVTPDKGPKHELAGGKASIDYPRMLGLGLEPETLLMLMAENGENVWKAMSLKDGTLGSSLAGGKPFDSPIVDRLTGRLIGASESGDYRRYTFFDPKMQAHWDAIVEAFKDDHVRFVSASDHLGVTGSKDPVLEQISPIKHVDAVNAPILLIHGKDDTVVPYDQSDDMYDALRHAGKAVEFVKLKHEDHWLSHSETRLQMLQATVAFLRKNNPPD
jgi:pimeloyl-ACP methyl ester carboxylesterase